MRKFLNHMLLFAIFPIIFIYSHNIDEVSFHLTLFPLALTVGITLLIYFLMSLIIKDNIKLTIIISIFLILFFSYGFIYTLLQNFQLYIFDIKRHRELLTLFIILYGFLIFIILKARGQLCIFNRFLNIVAVSLLTISFFNIAAHHFYKNTNKTPDRSVNQRDVANNKLSKVKLLSKPDIYYIILDEYAGSVTLKNVLAFDNSEFINFLSNFGFYIADQSHSNYANTFLSLSSSLNMEYVNFFQKTLGLDSKDRTLPYQMIRNSKVMNFLKSRGYKFINIMSGWGATNYNSYANLNIECGAVNEFLSLFINTTILLPFSHKLVGGPNIALALDKLSEVSKKPGPKFVFAHIVCPHEPLIDSMDQSRPSGNGAETVEIRKKQYLQRLLFLNQKVESLINNILTNSEIPPIIILQGDHGSDFTLGDLQDFQSGWHHPSDSMLKERMSIFNAYHLPARTKELLYNSISPVNTFRLIFNSYFGTGFEILPDRCYFSSYEFPYRFMDVSDRIARLSKERGSAGVN